MNTNNTHLYTIINTKTLKPVVDPYNSSQPMFRKVCSAVEAERMAAHLSISLGFECRAVHDKPAVSTGRNERAERYAELEWITGLRG